MIHVCIYLQLPTQGKSFVCLEALPMVAVGMSMDLYIAPDISECVIVEKIHLDSTLYRKQRTLLIRVGFLQPATSQVPEFKEETLAKALAKSTEWKEYDGKDSSMPKIPAHWLE